MKRRLLFSAFFIGALTMFVGCHRETSDADMVRFQALTKQYVTEELQIAGLDSVRVVKVDTVDNYEYAQIMVDLLHQMDAEVLYEYQAALMSDNAEAATELEIQVDEIASAGERWDMEVAATENAPKTVRFYLLTANYYAGRDVDQFYFFVTTDYKIHIPDPFAEL